jgi:hypothetical protein
MLRFNWRRGSEGRATVLPAVVENRIEEPCLLRFSDPSLLDQPFSGADATGVIEQLRVEELVGERLVGFEQSLRTAVGESEERGSDMATMLGHVHDLMNRKLSTAIAARVGALLVHYERMVLRLDGLELEENCNAAKLKSSRYKANKLVGSPLGIRLFFYPVYYGRSQIQRSSFDGRGKIVPASESLDDTWKVRRRSACTNKPPSSCGHTQEPIPLRSDRRNVTTVGNRPVAKNQLSTQPKPQQKWIRVDGW